MPRRARADNRADDRRSEALLKRAIAIARPFHPHPNPRVGAVVVAADGSVIGEGAHERAGTAHAEVLALEAAGRQAKGGTLYVTLEPCSHHGRTPPCVDAVIAAGLRRVVVGATDPDPRVAGEGMRRLAAAGIEVVAGVASDAAEELDAGYFHHRRTGRPRVTLKLAATLDGQSAAADDTSQWITGPEAREDAHRLRSRSDAVVVGAGTVRADDPRLDVRLPGYAGPQPVPVIIAGAEPLPSAARVLERAPLVYAPSHAAWPDGRPGLVTLVTQRADGLVDLGAVIKELGAKGLIDVMVEGGPRLAASFLHGGLVDRVVLYLGAKLAGGAGRAMVDGVWGTLGDATDVVVSDVTPIGGDVRITADLMGSAG